MLTGLVALYLCALRQPLYWAVRHVLLAASAHRSHSLLWLWIVIQLGAIFQPLPLASGQDRQELRTWDSILCDSARCKIKSTPEISALKNKEGILAYEHQASVESKGYNRYLCVGFFFFYGSSICWCLFFFSSVELCLLIILIIKHPQLLWDLPNFQNSGKIEEKKRISVFFLLSFFSFLTLPNPTAPGATWQHLHSDCSHREFKHTHWLRIVSCNNYCKWTDIRNKTETQPCENLLTDGQICYCFHDLLQCVCRFLQPCLNSSKDLFAPTLQDFICELHI